MAKQLLTAEILPSLVGKTISWNAPAYRANHPYGGISKITEVNLDQRSPIKSDTIEGDELNYAFQDEYNPGHISYSDSDRFVGFEILEPKYVIKHKTKGFFQKLPQSINWLTNTENAFSHATRFHSVAQAEKVAETLKDLSGKPLRVLQIMVLNAPHQPFKFENASLVKEVWNL